MVGDIPPSPRVPTGWFGGKNTIFLNPSPCKFPCQLLLLQLEGTQTEGGSDCHPASTQMEGARLPPIFHTPTGQHPGQG